MDFQASGIIAAMVTPFTKGGEFVDFDKVGPLAEHLVQTGASGLFPCGTTGEGMLMSTDERKEVLKEVVAAVGDKTKVIAHTGTLELATTIELSQHAAESGAYAVGVVAPGFYSYDDDALFAYYEKVAAALSGFPVLLYNIPGCAKNVLSPALVRRLAESVDNIVGIKDSSGNLLGLTQMIGEATDGFAVINGVDDYGFEAFAIGAPAAVSGTGNVILEHYASIYKAVQERDFDKARELQIVLEKATRVFQYGSKTAIFKEGLRLRGVDAGYVRAPQRELYEEEKKTLATGLAELGLI